MKLETRMLSLLVLTQVAFAATPTYHSIAEIPIKGHGGWDYLSFDSTSHRLFVSHADRVVVIDTRKNLIVGEILDTPGVHGIALAPELKKAFTSNGKEGKLSVVTLGALGSLSTQTKIQVGENPDSIVYDPARKEVYAFNGKSHSASIVDGQTDKVIATLPLPGKPEFSVVDPASGRVFVNIEDKSLIVAIKTSDHSIAASAASAAIAATWPIEGCESPTGLAIDLKRHRLFTVCENEKMVILDSKTGHVLATLPTGQGTDGVAFDPGLGLAFSANGKSATVTIVAEKAHGKFAVAQNLKTEPGARTITIDPETHKIYLPTADLKAGEGAKRPQPVDGTQRVLVYGP